MTQKKPSKTGAKPATASPPAPKSPTAQPTTPVEAYPPDYPLIRLRALMDEILATNLPPHVVTILYDLCHRVHTISRETVEEVRSLGKRVATLEKQNARLREALAKVAE